MAYNNRGNTYNGKGAYDQAIEDFDKAIELNPKLTEAYYNRGNAYYGKKDYDKAIADYNKAIELNPNYAEAYYNRGVMYMNKGSKAERNGNGAEAEKYYKQAEKDFAKARALGLDSPRSDKKEE